ncbi:acyltransferase family protein [Sphingobium yanoikuyae]|uniref:Acyltransferase n=1 Tax=Sphingobium yanoikuyae TaxID=13690 RepID=A0A9X7UDQ5_SPHYA|nr:acyltransferase [Sphingobium yanoikuyae]QNG48486.1 acyltransferase [Sphingobium yanoikuyae]
MKIKSIQYLRGVAALLVLVAHTFEHQFARPPLWLTRFGPFGVIMFFVISGFIMVLISSERKFDAWAFIRRRIVRVVPLYWLTTIAIALIAIATPHLLRSTEFSVSHLLLSLLFVPHADPSGTLSPLLKPGWTLNYEIFFYAVFAVFAGFTAGLRVALVTSFFAILIVLGAWIGDSVAILHFYTRPIIGAFCIGMVVGLATLRGYSLKGNGALLSAVGLLSAACLVLAFSLELRGSLVTTASLAFGAAGLLLLGIALDERVPTWQLGLLIGNASYSIYLTHMFAVAAIVAVVRRASHGFLLQWITPSAAIIFGVLIGITVYRLVEEPLLARFQRPQPTPNIAPESALPAPGDGGPLELMRDTVRRESR